MSYPRIVCAANRYRDLIIPGARHHDKIMNQLIKELILDDIESLPGEQGFIDQFGDFHTRENAWIIALCAGQILKRVGGDDANGGTLYSENLY